MRVLIVGGGGREHALAWKIAQSSKVRQIYCAPGNAGIAQLATCINLGAEDIEGLLNFALSHGIDLTVVGPEAPLVKGLANAFQARGLKVFGPTREAAALEGSKVRAKEFMARHGIPTAGYRVFTSLAEAADYVREAAYPLVIKADGLAAGKGVVVAASREEGLEALQQIMGGRIFGSAGNAVVIEECLQGEEVSILAFCDGETIIPMVEAQDHKRVFDGDRGPNTGGMGAYTPAPVYTPDLQAQVIRTILHPTLSGLRAEGIPYRGVLYAGLMLTGRGPQVLEYNCRFGDPETQPIMLRLQSDLVSIMEQVVEGRLSQLENRLSWSSQAAVCVTMAAPGYPGEYPKGLEITGLDRVPPGVQVFHAGTRHDNRCLVTAGGRVLGVTAAGDTLQQALDLTYQGVEAISFPGAHFRRDIGWRALGRSD